MSAKAAISSSSKSFSLQFVSPTFLSQLKAKKLDHFTTIFITKMVYLFSIIDRKMGLKFRPGCKIVRMFVHVMTDQLCDLLMLENQGLVQRRVLPSEIVLKVKISVIEQYKVYWPVWKCIGIIYRRTCFIRVIWTNLTQLNQPNLRNTTGDFHGPLALQEYTLHGEY